MQPFSRTPDDSTLSLVNGTLTYALNYAMLNTLFVTRCLIGWFNMRGWENIGFYTLRNS